MVKTKLINIIFFFILFPYFKLIPFIQAEVQPFSGIIAIIYLSLYGIKKRVALACFPYISVFFLYCVISMIMSISVPEYSMYSIFETIVVLLMPLLTFVGLYGNIKFISTKLFIYCVTAWATLGTIQMFMPSLLQITGIDSFMSLLISRFSAVELSEWDRGVTMFSPEPSYAAHSILFMFLFGVYLFRRKVISNKQLLYIITLCLWMVVLNKSGTVFALFLMFGGIYIVINLLRTILTNKIKNLYQLIYLSILIALLTLISKVLNDDLSSFRAINIINFILNSIETDGLGISTLVDISNTYGSTRFPQVLVGYYNIWLSNGFGTGIGSWAYTFSDTANLVGLSLEAAKPYAYAALVGYDMGLIGLVSFSVIFLVLMIDKYRYYNSSTFGTTCFVMAFFGLTANSMVSLPIYWVLFLLFYYDGLEKSFYRKEVLYNAESVTAIGQELT